MFKKIINDFHLTGLGGCRYGCFVPAGVMVEDERIFLQWLFNHHKVAMGMVNVMIGQLLIWDSGSHEYPPEFASKSKCQGHIQPQ